MNLDGTFNRRAFTTGITAAVAASCMPDRATASDDDAFALKYMLASSMYGHIYIGDILPEVAKTGATAIDLWPRTHGSQREQLDDIGEAKFVDMLKRHDVRLGCLTRYDLSPADRQDEMRDEIRLCGRLGGDTVVTSGRGPKNLKGGELKTAIKNFIEQQKPNIEVAEQAGVRLAIENHANNLIDSPDSLRYLAELSPSPNLAIAFAPYHLPQNATMMANLIGELGPSIALFYAWEYGIGSNVRVPKQQELMQLPGRGKLNFAPLVAALRSIRFDGWTEIFMHPVPRGIPIMESESAVTAQINEARAYLNGLLTKQNS